MVEQIHWHLMPYTYKDIFNLPCYRAYMQPLIMTIIMKGQNLIFGYTQMFPENRTSLSICDIGKLNEFVKSQLICVCYYIFFSNPYIITCQKKQVLINRSLFLKVGYMLVPTLHELQRTCHLHWIYSNCYIMFTWLFSESSCR